LVHVLEEMRLFRFETVLTFTVVGAGNDCFVLVAVVFRKGVNSIRADESSPLGPTRCLLSLVTNGNLTLCFYMG